MLPPALKTMFKLGILSLVISSCNYNPKTLIQENTRQITDMNGRVVDIPVKIKSLVAHRAGALRLICYLEATDLIIGIEGNERRRNVPYLYAYPELKKLPIFGSGNSADPELITSLQPDVIICTYLNVGEADDLQRKTGIPVLCLDYGDFNENKSRFYESLRLLASCIDKNTRADFLINYIENSLGNIQKKTSKKADGQKVYVGGIAYRGAHGINSTEPNYAPFRLANAHNLATSLTADPNLPTSRLNNILIDKEQIIEWDPPKIFIDASGYLLSKEDLSKESVTGSLLSAVVHDEVYVLLPHIWNTINYEHILINSYYIAKVLYPEEFKSMKIEQKANEIYKTFLGKPIYQDLLKLYGMGCQKINIL